MNIINNIKCSLLKCNNFVLSQALVQINRDAASTCTRDEDAQCSVAHLYSHWTKQFENAGISEPRQSAFCKINDGTKKEIEDLCKKRLLKMPVQYIIKEWQFRDLVLKMQPPVFIPRPETETLIDIIQNDLDIDSSRTKKNILEICCGSGAISLSLLKHNPNINIIAIDKSEEACLLTEKNARFHGLLDRLQIKNYEISDVQRLQDISGDHEFDFIVSNPPYVPSGDVETVQPEIKLYEDLDALDGGPDGLNLIKPILQISSSKLKQRGNLYLETDSSHPEKISQYIKSRPELKLKFKQTYKDFCNKDRFVKIEKIP